MERADRLLPAGRQCPHEIRHARRRLPENAGGRGGATPAANRLRHDRNGEIVWRFDQRAAEHARGFEFHPDQVVEDQPGGSLIVRFRAAGWTEMAWHLSQWGDTVEVIAPEALREMVEGYRRGDFYPVLP